jgi:hypothetical protein
MVKMHFARGSFMGSMFRNVLALFWGKLPMGFDFNGIAMLP